jgi:hypothetical protein
MLNASALKSIKDKAIVTVRRFPLPILIASVAACCLIWLIDSKERDPYFYNVIHFVLTLSLALPAFTGLCFFNERSKHPLYLQLLGQVILVILGAWYHYSIPVSFGERDAARHAILILSMHLWVAFAPFVRYREIQGFLAVQQTFVYSISYRYFVFRGFVRWIGFSHLCRGSAF